MITHQRRQALPLVYSRTPGFFITIPVIVLRAGGEKGTQVAAKMEPTIGLERVRAGSIRCKADITRLPTNAEPFAKLIPTAALTVLPGRVGHATFRSLCTPAAVQGPDWLSWVCHDEEGVNRAELHRQPERLASQFFQQALAGD